MTGPEYIHVILVDFSQLARMGMVSLLNQMKYPFYVREIPTPDRLNGLSAKDLGGLFIISSSFLNKCPPELIHGLQKRLGKTVCILIHDSDGFPGEFVNFTETIEFSDPGKTIIRKMERQLNAMVRNNPARNPAGEISDREKEVLRLVAVGLTNKEIGDKLFISSHTVITHRKNITAKLGIKTIAGLTMYALINHLIFPEDIH